MPNTLGGQIIGELGEIAQEVGKQTVQVPSDIAGKALESLGTSSAKTQKSATIPPNNTWEAIDGTTDKKIKQKMARKALEDLLAGAGRKQKEPSIWERLQMEQDQKKKEETAKNVQAAQTLQAPTSKRPRGDLYGAKAKTTATENRNVRQD